MKILHLDINHSMITKSLSTLGLKNDIDLTSNKFEIGNIIGDYHGLVVRSRIKIDKNLIDKARPSSISVHIPQTSPIEKENSNMTI